MNNGLPGPNLTETVTGGKTLELSKYDKVRKPHKAITDDTKIKVTARTLSAELCCPICLDLLTCTMTTKECLHRFCSECITTALMRGNKECPTCRKKIVSKRSLRRDPNFDFLISKIWPDRKQYDAELNASMQMFKEQSNVAALQKSIEDGIKAQSAYRKQRVQGSYDYEKRKRRPKAAAMGGAEEGGSSNSAAAGGGSGTSIEQVTVTLAPAQLDGTNVSIGGGGNGNNNMDHHHQQQKQQQQHVVGVEESPMISTENSADESESGSDSSSEDSSSLLSDSSRLSSSSVGSTSTQQSVRPSPQRLHRAVSEEQQQQQQRHVAPMPKNAPVIMEEEEEEEEVEQKEETEQELAIGPNGQIVGLEQLMEELKRQGVDELEVELVPAKAMLQRNTGTTIAATSPALALPAQLRTSHYIKTSVETTMAALAEFLAELSIRPMPTPKKAASHSAASIATSASEQAAKQPQPVIKKEEQQQQQQPNVAADSTSPNFVQPKFRPEYFYILDRWHQLRRLALSDCLATAFLLSIRWDQHLLIFFDDMDEEAVAAQMQANNGQQATDMLLSAVVGEEMLKSIGKWKNAKMEEEQQQQQQQAKEVKMEIKEEEEEMPTMDIDSQQQISEPSTSTEQNNHRQQQQPEKVPKMEVDDNFQ